MPESTSTSKRAPPWALPAPPVKSTPSWDDDASNPWHIVFFTVLTLTLFAVLAVPTAFAEAPAPAKEDRTQRPEEEDFAQTPFTEYGEFNEEEEEAADTAFFQRGRFFGMSAGLGYQGIVGNRGLVWQGGFPNIDLKLHYWFDFNLAIDLGGYFASHFRRPASNASDNVNISWLQAGLTVKYYFDTRNLAAPLSFASPYILGGGGSYTKIESLASSGESQTESTIGFNAGAGLEFVIKPRKLYFALENRWHFMSFSDTGSQDYSASGIPDLSGAFFTIVGSILFTW
jgi:hypothetical protein